MLRIGAVRSRPEEGCPNLNFLFADNRELLMNVVALEQPGPK